MGKWTELAQQYDGTPPIAVDAVKIALESPASHAKQNDQTTKSPQNPLSELSAGWGQAGVWSSGYDQTTTKPLLELPCQPSQVATEHNDDGLGVLGALSAEPASDPWRVLDPAQDAAEIQQWERRSGAEVWAAYQRHLAQHPEANQ